MPVFRPLAVSVVTAVGVLLSGLAAAQTSAPPADSQPATAPFTAGWDDGFALQSADGNYRLVFGIVAQVDGRFSVDDPTPIVNTFTVRKLRPALTGRVARYFDFKLVPDFGNGNAVLVDAAIDIRFSPAFRIRTGKDKTPVGYELLISDPYLLFPERMLASSLVPNRDVGIQVLGDLAGGRLHYAGGVFNGVPDGTSSTSDVDASGSKDLAGRIVVRPFRSNVRSTGALSGLGINLGGSSGRQTGALPQFRTSVGQTYFSYAEGATANGVRHRVTPAVFYYHRAFGAFAEYTRSSQPVVRDGITTGVTSQAWGVTGSYLLTGEAASDRGVQPHAAFDPPEGHWGALQVVARYSQLTVDRDAFDAGLASAAASRKAQAFTIGANWYPSEFIKYYATFERTMFDGSRPDENVILFRAQLAF